MEGSVTRISAERRASVSASAVAGFLSGIIMALSAMSAAAGQGMSFWHPVNLVSGLYFGLNAADGGTLVTAAGVLTHLAVATFFGALFGLYLSRAVSMVIVFLLAIFYGLIIWAFMTYLVLPNLNFLMMEHVNRNPEWWLGLHVLYGGILGFLAPPIALAMDGRGAHNAS